MKKTVQRTYLEMAHRPTFSSPAFPAGVEIIRAVRPTISFYRFLYASVGGPWHWVDRLRMSEEALRSIIQSSRVQVFVLYREGVPAGYVEFNQGSPDEVEIAYFGLMPEFIGAGLGKLFLQWSIIKAWSLGVERVWLHTCTLDHPSARPLYEKMGFVAYDSEEYEFE